RFENTHGRRIGDFHCTRSESTPCRPGDQCGSRPEVAGWANIEEVKNSLALIVRDGHRASAVIRRVREFVKHESNGSTLLDLREVVRETIALMRFELDKSQIALSLTFPDNLSTIRGDRVQLEQVILNLIVNACEAMAAIE